MAGLDELLSSAVTWISTNLLVDTVRITLPATGAPVYNPDTGQNEYPPGEVLYEGPGAVLGDAGQSRITVAPDARQMWVGETTSHYRLLTPLTASIAPKDAIVIVVAVHNTANVALLGRSWTCQDPAHASTVEVVRTTPLDQNRDARSE
ncbi:DUF6093 family protein [Streptomyces lydicus]|uniref:DUF6093 family protein n=1 Tax=Streptomyces lydicus TaxID=47763 RepID=UPI003792E3C5